VSLELKNLKKNSKTTREKNNLLKKQFCQMEANTTKNHWNNIYKTNVADKVGWFQPNPAPSIEMLKTSGFDKDIRIVDIGGGDSYFAECLLDLGYKNISVLDISESAIDRAKKRMGKKADNIEWICSNILDFKPTQKYDLWHDRAVFHFLNKISDIKTYKQVAYNSLNDKSKLILATFSELGPNSCSGLPVIQYSESSLYKLFIPDLHMVRWHYYDHITPSKTKQNFIYCCFSKIK